MGIPLLIRLSGHVDPTGGGVVFVVSRVPFGPRST